jgi:diaminopimelate epimerase
LSEPLEFYKMNGAGNDFIVADDRHHHWSAYPLSALARSLCRPHLSVGADGLILLENSKKAHFKIRIFNSDGSESPMCGNGARCAARYALLKVIAGRSMTIEAGPDVIAAEVLADLSVRVEIPGEPEPPKRLDVSVDGRALPAFLTTTGVPHLVIFVRDQAALDALPLAALGPRLRHAPEAGPQGANVDFVALSPAPPFSIRTFERGVEAETLACGTGVTAGAWVMKHAGVSGDSTTFRTRSGRDLTVDILEGQASMSRFALTGDASLVFRGTLSEEALREALR